MKKKKFANRFSATKHLSIKPHQTILFTIYFNLIICISKRLDHDPKITGRGFYRRHQRLGTSNIISLKRSLAPKRLNYVLSSNMGMGNMLFLFAHELNWTMWPTDHWSNGHTSTHTLFVFIK